MKPVRVWPYATASIILFGGVLAAFVHLAIHTVAEVLDDPGETKVQPSLTFAQHLARENADANILGPPGKIYWSVIEQSKVEMQNGIRRFDVLIGENDLKSLRQHNLLHHWLRKAGFKVLIHDGHGLWRDVAAPDGTIKKQIHFNIQIDISHLYGWDQLE